MATYTAQIEITYDDEDETFITNVFGDNEITFNIINKILEVGLEKAVQQNKI